MSAVLAANTLNKRLSARKHCLTLDFQLRPRLNRFHAKSCKRRARGTGKHKRGHNTVLEVLSIDGIE